MNDSQRTMQALLTYEDYCQIPSDENRYEVIDGALFMSPSPVERHQRIFTHLIIRLGRFAEESGLGRLYGAPFDVILSDHNVVQPDLLFVSKERLSIITEKNVQGAPDLVVEILSPSTADYDRGVKRRFYAAHGSREFW
ncbi:MAG: Uma2 family endonuclease, partial [Rhodothermaceae bacterium]|nr:Uma2 family endonuclease [Rhodothermaceae bacterium]